MAAARAALEGLKEAEAAVSAAMDLKSAAAALQANRVTDLASAFVLGAVFGAHLADTERDLGLVAAIVNEIIGRQSEVVLGLGAALAITSGVAATFAAAQTDAAQAAVRALAATSGQALALRELGGQLAITAGAGSALALREVDLTHAMLEKTAAATDQNGALRDLTVNFISSAVAANLLSLSETNVANAVNNSGNAARRGIGWWGLTRNAIHWIISGSAELLAVLIPATVAAASWAFVWVQGAGMVEQHLSSLFTATEALGQAAGKTYGNFLGLKGSFQSAQDAANPQVYQALGGALNTVKETSGGLAQTGLEVGRVFDAFMGRIVYDFSAAGKAGDTLRSALDGMVPDLTGVGEVFGSLGHSLALFATQMPGLAEVLLHSLAGLLGLATGALQLAADLHVGTVTIITLVMGLEEINRWGGLVVNLLGRMGLASTQLATGILNPARAAGVLTNVLLALPRAGTFVIGAFGQLVSSLGPFGGSLDAAGQDIQNFASDARDAMSGMSVWWGAAIAIAIAALGFLIFKLATAKTSAQEFAASLQKVTQAASNMTVFNAIGSALSQLQGKINDNKVAMLQLAEAADVDSTATGNLAYIHRIQIDRVTQLNQVNSQLHAGQVQQIRDAGNVVSGGEKIASMYGVTFPEALGAADLAGVKLSKGILTSSGQLNAQGQQIRNLISGYQAMGMASGEVGSDMLAVAVQTGLAGTQISKVTQAWQEFMQNLTAGTSGLGEMKTELSNIGQITVSTAGKFGETQQSYSLSVGQFANSLKNFGAVGSQAWQNFNTVLTGSMVPLLNWFQTAQAESAITGPNFQKSVLDMVSGLTAFAAKSPAAQAELVAFAQASGLPISNFKQLIEQIKSSGANMNDLQGQVTSTTLAMSQLSTVAQNLGNVMASAFTSAISQATLKASGFYQAQQALTSAIQRFGVNSPQAAAAARQLTADWDAAQQMAGRVASQAKAAQVAIDAMHGKSIVITAFMQQVGSLPDAQATGFGAIGTSGLRITQHAAGTDYAPPGWSWVGEEGPELVRLGGGERVVPNGQLNSFANAQGGAGAGAVTEVHVYLDGKELYGNMVTRVRKSNVANGNRSKSGAPSGAMAPRAA
jgi:hypothetical protein